MKVGDTPDHEPGTNRDEFDDQPDDEAFAALSPDLLEWAEYHAEMHDYADEGSSGDRPE